MSIVRADSRPLEENAQGAYLTFDASSQGVLFLNWSKKSVPKSLMYFKPVTPVPEFKYKTYGGKTELVRGCQGEVRKYYQGWCAFFKVVKQFAGEVTFIENGGPIEVQICLHLSDNSVLRLEVGKAYSLKGVVAVAALPRDSLALDAKSFVPKQFMEKGAAAGAALTLS